jgi:sodium/potassium-transporting ATPase subunit alpha
MRLLFSSVNKFAFSINRYPTETSDLCLFTKGAPERVWKMCTHILINGVPVPKDEHW